MDVHPVVRTAVSRRTEVVAPLPMDAKNFEFVMRRVHQELPKDRKGLDNAYMISTDGERIIFSWPLPDEVI